MRKTSTLRYGCWVGLIGLVGLVAFFMAGSALAGGGKINGDGNVELVVHFRFPPLQPDIDRVKEQVQRASELMCDATEGQMKIAKARLMAGGASETAGDVWLYPPGAINRSRSDGGPSERGEAIGQLSHVSLGETEEHLVLVVQQDDGPAVDTRGAAVGLANGIEKLLAGKGIGDGAKADDRKSERLIPLHPVGHRKDVLYIVACKLVN